MRFEGEHGEQFVGRIGDVGALVETHAVWDPVQPGERHDVIHAEHASNLHLVAKRFGEVSVSLRTRCPRQQRAESPILSTGEALIRRSTDRHVGSEECLP